MLCWPMRVKKRERESCISLSLPLKEEFSLYQNCEMCLIKGRKLISVTQIYLRSLFNYIESRKINLRCLEKGLDKAWTKFLLYWRSPLLYSVYFKNWLNKFCSFLGKTLFKFIQIKFRQEGIIIIQPQWLSSLEWYVFQCL